MAMVVPFIKVLSKIPWKDVLKFSPEILKAASSLFARNKNSHSKQETLESRIVRLESNEKEQAELIENLAERQEFLLRTAQVLDTRIKLLFGLSIVLLIALVFALLRLRSA